MKINRKYIIIGLLALILCGCENKKDVQSKNEKVVDIKHRQLNNLDKNFVDKLISEYQVKKEASQLVKADSVACVSDGDSSEEISMGVVEMYNFNKKYFFKICYLKQLHCLENALVHGFSEDLSILKGAERQKEISAIRSEAQAAINDLSVEERINAQKVINRIKPELFD
ncbi:hypothetical protein [Hymenobacter pini]|uniref:hypothetical protein n=1 Tax=Hymenobacter pini TaxID=2880879 RepID=UPI001CF131CD|nr:hypothetical protein [Hymenobacter pini]MCA8832755.1 hypothetical protein [Hymenobacter pini]